MSSVYFTGERENSFRAVKAGEQATVKFIGRAKSFLFRACAYTNVIAFPRVLVMGLERRA